MTRLYPALDLKDKVDLNGEGNVRKRITELNGNEHSNASNSTKGKSKDTSTITTPILEGSSNFITSSSPLNSSKRPRLLPNQLDVFRLARDLGMRPMIWKFPPNQRDEIRRAYIKVGPNQPILDNDPFSGDKSHRRFQASWLQLALVAASREVLQIHEFFTQLNSIVTIVSTSSKRHDQLQEVQAIENANLVAQNELETGKCENQISTLQRVGDTRWSSHFNSICSLVKIFTATSIVLNNIIDDGTTYALGGEAYGVSKILLSFEFVFTLHLMKEIMGITNVLCQALQQQSQDILNAMHFVSTSKLLLQQLRDGGWCNFLANVKDFCEKHEIEVPNMSAQYVFGRGRSRQPNVTVEHHYRIDVFLATIDSQIQELNSRFNEQIIELLTLSCTLDPKDNFKSFNIEEISKLAEKFYPLDFPSNELNILKSHLQHYQHDIPNHLKGIGTLFELCKKLQEMEKSRTYHMVDRLIRIVLTLSLSIATTERAFSAMKIIKTRLRSKMADEFLADNLVIYIEKELAAIFDTNSIIDDFENRKKRRIAFS
ncbi:uncharacterized protein LOC130965998 [Arachis stenosperma]|uniref:uncharacterized protein LOC130965998 n=1 Tax=Arachis stenosperma TaxID=217475 RepID=UPI0025AD22F7|nr:uncharacterized protein LOC130965998 [Arachis stenosperma]